MTIQLAVSTVIFALRPAPESELGALWIPLVRRISEPFQDRWALPGGWVSDDESLSDAASRNLLETTALEPSYLEQLWEAISIYASRNRRFGGAVDLPGA